MLLVVGRKSTQILGFYDGRLTTFVHAIILQENFMNRLAEP